MIRKKKWSTQEQGEFLQKLGQLTSKGYPLVRAIELMLHRYKHDRKATIQKMMDQLKDGYEVHTVLSNSRFPKDVLAIIEFSRSYGSLSSAFLNSGRLLLKKSHFQKRFAAVMRYPLLLLFLTFWIGFVFVRFIFPQFQTLYSSLQLQMPLMTRITLTLLLHLPYFLFALLVLAASLAGYAAYWRKKGTATEMLSLWLKFPVFKNLIPLYVTHYFCLQTGELLKNGFSLTDALSKLEENGYTAFFSEEAGRLRYTLTEGVAFYNAVEDLPYYTEELSTLIKHSQDCGTLGEDMSAYGEWLFEVLEEKSTAIIQKIQPALFTIIGITVLFLFTAMFYPVLKIMEAI
ncbi:competence type IV pilus assembly protein ComGB [Fictibacillus iocasae]|uniref:Competence type IV pilus assembly protein ComGB n=1 Tax=Fictibacillus iocasae TaxID=2715437 RepID=A0ABW2NMR5_9BACL